MDDDVDDVPIVGVIVMVVIIFLYLCPSRTCLRMIDGKGGIKCDGGGI